MGNEKSKNLMRFGRAGAAVLSAACLLGGCAAKTDTLEDVIHKTAQYEQKQVTDPSCGTLGGEWTVLALARSQEKVDQEYLDRYLANLKKTVEETDGVLSTRKYTEYSRVVLALAALGENPGAFDGYDLAAPLTEYEAVVSQGINGPVFALIALHAAGEADQPVTAQYLDFIRAKELTDGGFALSESAEAPEADLTAMTLQALALYPEADGVDEMIERGVDVLGDLQNPDGTYTSWGEDSSESIAQSIIALSALGIDCNEDERFKTDGKGLYDRLMKYANKEGGFGHTLESGGDPMATDQALCALVAYERFKNGRPSFYEMSDPRQN